MMQTIKDERFIRKLFFFMGTMAISILGLFPMASAGEIYKYVDREGIIHFTDRFESIPGEYRPQIKIIKEVQPSPILPSPQQTGVEGGKEDLKKQEPEKSQLASREAISLEKAKEEQKLKARAEKEKQIEELRKQIKDRQKQQRSLRTNWMVYDRYTIVRLNREIEDLEKQIKILQNELEE